MANKYAITGGGAWGGATWATQSNQAVSDTTKPTASDDAVLDQYSGSVTVDAAEGAKTLTMTGYAGTLTINATRVLTLQNFTHTLGGTLAGTGKILLQASSILNGTATSSSGVVLDVQAGATTLNTGLNCVWGSILQSTGVITLNGSVKCVNATLGTLWASGTQRLYITGNLTSSSVSGSSGTPIVVMAGTGTFGTSGMTLGINVEIDCGAGTCTFGTDVRLGSLQRRLKYISGNVDTSTCVLGVFANFDFDTAGMTITRMDVSGSTTMTLYSNLNVTNLTNNRGAWTVSGAFDINTTTFTSIQGSTTSLVAGRTLTAQNLYFTGNSLSSNTIKSVTGSSNTNINYTGTEDGYLFDYVSLTDVNFTSPRKMYNWWGTNTRVTNCDVVATNTPRLVMPSLVGV